MKLTSILLLLVMLRVSDKFILYQQDLLSFDVGFNLRELSLFFRSCRLF